jgi:hypothetical protein
MARECNASPRPVFGPSEQPTKSVVRKSGERSGREQRTVRQLEWLPEHRDYAERSRRGTVRLSDEFGTSAPAGRVLAGGYPLTTTALKQFFRREARPQPRGYRQARITAGIMQLTDQSRERCIFRHDPGCGWD